MTDEPVTSSQPATSAPPAQSSVPAASPAAVSYQHFAALDLRVAKVLEAREHPNANKLLLLKIKVGEVEKQIVAGIRGHYEPESLAGKLIVVVNNLEPAMIRGEESNGMLLAASDGSSVVLLEPGLPIADGAKVK
jgi:methionyl-tRNA synthetase